MIQNPWKVPDCHHFHTSLYSTFLQNFNYNTFQSNS